MSWLRFTVCALWGLFVLFGLTGCDTDELESGRQQVIDFSADWMFLRCEKSDGPAVADPEHVHELNYDDRRWTKVFLPHDWGMDRWFARNQAGVHLNAPAIGFYRKRIFVEEPSEPFAYRLEFNGGIGQMALFVNARPVAVPESTLTPFTVDITDYLKFGARNIISIRMDTGSMPPSPYYHGGGLFHTVQLRKIRHVHIEPESVRYNYQFDEKGDVDFMVNFNARNTEKERLSYWSRAEVYELSETGKIERKVGKVEGVLPLQMKIPTVRRWSPERPNLYRCVLSIHNQKGCMDRYEVTVGFRTVALSEKKGLLINGAPTPINGVRLMPDNGALGMRASQVALRRKIHMLKEMGVNAVQLVDFPPSTELLNLCDQKGIMVFLPVNSVWGKLAFMDLAVWPEVRFSVLNNVRALVRKFRLHPAVVMWSLGDAPSFADEGHLQAAVAHELIRAVEEESLSQRPITVNVAEPGALRSPFCSMFPITGLAFHADAVPGYFEDPRYAMNLLYHARSSGTFSLRNFYAFPEEAAENARPLANGLKPISLSGYGLNFLPGGNTPEAEAKLRSDCSHLIGEFVWTAADYVEPDFAEYTARVQVTDAVYQDSPLWRSSFSGVLDSAGFPKDVYYWYQALWRVDKPVLHILPHWTWPGREGKRTPVHVFSNADQVELFVNGISQGRLSRRPNSARFEWNDVVYVPGTLRAIGLKNGEKWGEESLATANKPAKLFAVQETRMRRSAYPQFCFVRIEVRDALDRVVPISALPITLEVKSGKGMVFRLDNGNPYDVTPFNVSQKNAFGGLLCAVIRVDDTLKSPLVLEVSAKDFPPVRLKLRADES